MEKSLDDSVRTGLSTYESNFKKCGKFFISQIGLVKEIILERDCPPLPSDVEACKAFIRKFINYQDDYNYEFTSYGLKHAIEAVRKHKLGLGDNYLTNGSFIAAAAEMGFDIKPVGGMIVGGGKNAVFNMDFTKLNEYQQENNLIFS